MSVEEGHTQGTRLGIKRKEALLLVNNNIPKKTATDLAIALFLARKFRYNTLGAM